MLPGCGFEKAWRLFWIRIRVLRKLPVNMGFAEQAIIAKLFKNITGYRRLSTEKRRLNIIMGFPASKKCREPHFHFAAESEGFEPSSPGGLTHFECAPLWPLRYDSMIIGRVFSRHSFIILVWILQVNSKLKFVLLFWNLSFSKEIKNEGEKVV